MKRIRFCRWLALLIFVATISSPIWGESVVPAASRVTAKYGQLQILQGKLCDQAGNPIQLKGMSTMGLQWFSYSAKTVQSLVTDWHISVIRVALYTQEGGYIENPALKGTVKKLVEEAIRQGIYVIIDWHILSDNNPNIYKTQAKAFFTGMAKQYGAYPNVIYEICNEPNGAAVTWKDKIKPYAEYIIPVIRSIDPDNIIIVGTDTWSQGVKAASEDPLAYNNIMYALHFYAGTHGQALRDQADEALANGIAVFVTEWGTTQSSGNGGVYLEEAQEWLEWMNRNKISWTNWSLCNKSESSAALKPGTGVDGPWKESQLSDSGLWVKSKILSD